MSEKEKIKQVLEDASWKMAIEDYRTYQSFLSDAIETIITDSEILEGDENRYSKIEKIIIEIMETWEAKKYFE